MDRIHTPDAPEAIGPYSQAMKVDGWIFCSGQIPLDPTTMALVEGDVSAQTEQVMENMKAVLHEAGASLGHVVKTTVFLSDMALFGAMNEVYGRHFGDHRPARATVAVRELPKSVDVEIECIARLPG
jgi:2-iminobutanoate/2-iminopropanoate deaminase